MFIQKLALLKILFDVRYPVNGYCVSFVIADAISRRQAMRAERAGSGNLNSADKWNFCLCLAYTRLSLIRTH